MSNVVIKRDVAADVLSTYNKSAIHTEDLPNGAVFALEERDATDELVWKVKKPVANQKGLWMAISPEVVRVDKAHGGSLDPRDFVNAAGKVFDATYLAPMDEIEIYGEEITGLDTAKYLVADTTFVLKAAASAPTSGGLCLRKTGTNVLHIGDTAIAPQTKVTYVFEVVDN